MPAWRRRTAATPRRSWSISYRRWMARSRIPAIDALAARAQSIYSEIGKKIELSGNGGASESALAMAEGTPALDGLGFVGGDFHTDHEWIDLTSVTPRLYLFTRLLMETSRSRPEKS